MKICKHNSRPGLFSAFERDGNIEVAPQGGGFLTKFTPSEFDEQFTVVQAEFPLKKGTVTADFLPENVILHCYSTGLRWNGWGLPLFDRENANRVVELLSPQNPSDQDLPLHWAEDLILCPNDDFEVAEPESEDNPRFFKSVPETHVINGVSRELWSIGDGWTWNPVKFEVPDEDPRAGAAND